LQSLRSIHTHSISSHTLFINSRFIHSFSFSSYFFVQEREHEAAFARDMAARLAQQHRQVEALEAAMAAEQQRQREQERAQEQLRERMQVGMCVVDPYYDSDLIDSP
jgi:hypothetical protein